MRKHRPRYGANKKYDIEYVYDGVRRNDSVFSKLEIEDFTKMLLTADGKVTSITVLKWGEPIRHWERDVTNTMYCPLHDAFLNPAADEWAEAACSDPTCDFCVGRPSRPSECRHQVTHHNMTPPAGWT